MMKGVEQHVMQESLLLLAALATVLVGSDAQVEMDDVCLVNATDPVAPIQFPVHYIDSDFGSWTELATSEDDSYYFQELPFTFMVENKDLNVDGFWVSTNSLFTFDFGESGCCSPSVTSPTQLAIFVGGGDTYANWMGYKDVQENGMEGRAFHFVGQYYVWGNEPVKPVEWEVVFFADNTVRLAQLTFDTSEVAYGENPRLYGLADGAAGQWLVGGEAVPGTIWGLRPGEAVQFDPRSCCGRNAMLTTDADGTMSCQCNPGYDWDMHLENTCSDVDECTMEEWATQCHPFAFCENTPGSFQCVCATGFEGDGFTCEPAQTSTPPPSTPMPSPEPGDPDGPEPEPRVCPVAGNVFVRVTLGFSWFGRRISRSAERTLQWALTRGMSVAPECVYLVYTHPSPLGIFVSFAIPAPSVPAAVSISNRIAWTRLAMSLSQLSPIPFFAGRSQILPVPERYRRPDHDDDDHDHDQGAPAARGGRVDLSWLDTGAPTSLKSFWLADAPAASRRADWSEASQPQPASFGLAAGLCVAGGLVAVGAVGVVLRRRRQSREGLELGAMQTETEASCEA